ncbi:MAG: hypothetical protein RR466_08445 [Hungatella sp.]
MRKQTKLVAVLSAAALLAIGASMTSFAAAPRWEEQSGTWVYLDNKGDKVYDTWKKSGNQYFYLDENGEMATSRLVETDNETYYVDANGAKVMNSWISVDNEDAIEVGGNDVSTIWYYMGSTGKAVKATNTSVVVKELTHGTGKAKYLFDGEGHMLSGWQDDAASTANTYYLGDENEGWALTGWQYLEPKENGAEAYDDSKWFYFDGGKAVKGENSGTKTKFIKGAYYTFNEDGVMKDDWYGVSTPPSASGANAYASGSGGLGTGWVYTTEPGNDNSDSHWYYLVNVKSGNKTVARGVPFNYNGTAGDQAKIIKSKTYLFDSDGIMKTGVQTLAAIPAIASDSKALPAGIYYFNKADGSVKGQMVTGKATVETDGEKSYYHFQKDGRAYTNKVQDGCLYGADGMRINATDGNTYEIIRTADVIAAKGGINDEIPANVDVIVNSNGRIKQSGTVKIDDVTYVVNKYVATVKK